MLLGVILLFQRKEVCFEASAYSKKTLNKQNQRIPPSKDFLWKKNKKRVQKMTKSNVIKCNKRNSHKIIQ